MVCKKMPRNKVPIVCTNAIISLQDGFSSRNVSNICKDWNPVGNSPNFQSMLRLFSATCSRESQRATENMAKCIAKKARGGKGLENSLPSRVRVNSWDISPPRDIARCHHWTGIWIMSHNIIFTPKLHHWLSSQPASNLQTKWKFGYEFSQVKHIANKQTSLWLFPLCPSHTERCVPPAIFASSWEVLLTIL